MAVNERPSTETRLEPLSPHVGVVMGDGLSLSGSPSSETLEVIRDALARHLVLVIPGQQLSPADLRDFASNFGEPHIRHDDDGVIRAARHPDVFEMRKEPDGTRLFGGASWHADVTFTKPGGLRLGPPCAHHPSGRR